VGAAVKSYIRTNAPSGEDLAPLARREVELLVRRIDAYDRFSDRC
jgi:hypothetical protein